MTFCLKNPNYFPYSLFTLFKRIVINLMLIQLAKFILLRNHVYQNFVYFTIMGERHSKRSSTALYIAIIALIISLINLYLTTELPGVD